MKLIITIVALVIALLVAFAVSGVLSEEKETAAPVVVQPTQTVPIREPETDVFVATRDIDIGEEITSSDIETVKWPSRKVLGGFIQASQGSDNIVGFTASAPIVQGEPIFSSKLRNPNDPSFISGQLAEGMRAVTINTNLVDSVAGFVSPGDFVDIIFTFDMDKTALDTGDLEATGGDEENRVSVSEMLLPNVKILAVDRRVANSSDGTNPPVPVSVTLAVNQRDAQKLKLAEKIGQLTLTLRSLADKDKKDMPRPSAEQDLTRLLPPAYFPALFDSDAPYDYNVIDLYGGATQPKEDNKTKDGETKSLESKFMEVNIYRGTQAESVEVNRQ